jgi:hypothetical protein
MPTTSDGDTVYAEPAVMEAYVQTDANQFSLSTTGSPSAWRAFLESIQARMKSRIDEYCNRDFEDHAGDTITLDGGAEEKRLLYLPTPVRAVSEVRVDGTALDTDQWALSQGDQLVRLDPDSDSASATATVNRLASTAIDEGPTWATGYGNIAVDLDWGYTSPPPDVVEAELKLVAHTVTGLAQLREGMVVQQDDVDVTVQLPTAMTAEIRGLLGEHRERGRMGAIL